MDRYVLTEANLERRIEGLRGHYDRRGVGEAADEARRQFAWPSHGDAEDWIDEAECAAGLITPAELNQRSIARQAAS